jgi:hypothetical protein
MGAWAGPVAARFRLYRGPARPRQVFRPNGGPCGVAGFGRCFILFPSLCLCCGNTVFLSPAARWRAAACFLNGASSAVYSPCDTVKRSRDAPNMLSCRPCDAFLCVPAAGSGEGDAGHARSGRRRADCEGLGRLWSLWSSRSVWRLSSGRAMGWWRLGAASLWLGRLWLPGRLAGRLPSWLAALVSPERSSKSRPATGGA